MDALAAVETWDAALRAGDWDGARAVLADDATYTMVDDAPADAPACTSADQIVALMRSWKGKVPDVEVLTFDERGDHVIAHLRQPALGPDAEWFQVLHVRDGQIVSLRDAGSREAAEVAATGGA